MRYNWGKQKETIWQVGITHTVPNLLHAPSLGQAQLLWLRPLQHQNGFGGADGGEAMIFTMSQFAQTSRPVKPHPDSPPLLVKIVTTFPMLQHSESKRQLAPEKLSLDT